MTIINLPPTTVIADNTTCSRTQRQLIPLSTSCTSTKPCVHFFITKSKHRKGNFISVCRHLLCFEEAHKQASSAEHGYSEAGGRLKRFGIRRKLLTARGRKFTKVLGLMRKCLVRSKPRSSLLSSSLSGILQRLVQKFNKSLHNAQFFYTWLFGSAVLLSE